MRFARVMRGAGGGAIINISRVDGHIPVPFMAICSASKFAMNAIGKGARLELKRDNINVLTVCPGYVSTDFGQHVVADRKGSVRPQSVRGVTAERGAHAAHRGYCTKKREADVPWTRIHAITLCQSYPA